MKVGAEEVAGALDFGGPNEKLGAEDEGVDVDVDVGGVLKVKLGLLEVALSF